MKAETKAKELINSYGKESAMEAVKWLIRLRLDNKKFWEKVETKLKEHDS